MDAKTAFHPGEILKKEFLALCTLSANHIATASGAYERYHQHHRLQKRDHGGNRTAVGTCPQDLAGILG